MKIVKPEDLPEVGEFHLVPSLESLSLMKTSDLKKVVNVVIENEYGRVKFLEPINLLRKNLN